MGLRSGALRTGVEFRYHSKIFDWKRFKQKNKQVFLSERVNQATMYFLSAERYIPWEQRLHFCCVSEVRSSTFRSAAHTAKM